MVWWCMEIPSDGDCTSDSHGVKALSAWPWLVSQGTGWDLNFVDTRQLECLIESASFSEFYLQDNNSLSQNARLNPQTIRGLLMAPKEEFFPDLELLLDMVSTSKPQV